MTARLREQRGEIALPQLLMAMVIFLVVLSATLFTFESGLKINRRTEERNDAQDSARRALGGLARELRNVASPNTANPDAVERAAATDLIFRTVDPNGPNAGQNESNIRRMRYCLSTSDPTNKSKIWLQTQTWTTQAAPAVPSSTSCPGSGWGSSRVLVDRVTNMRDSLTRPVFTYNSTVLTDISSVHAEVFVDMNPKNLPPETRLSSGVFLRNQNRRPTACFSPPIVGAQGVILNGSCSSDPEGHALIYRWYGDGQPIGGSPVLTWRPSTTGSHTITLEVEDAGGLKANAPSQSVTT